MTKRRIEDIIAELAKPVTDKNKFELVDVEFVKEGANRYLRIYIDKPGGITIDDCQIVSEEISDLLDQTDPIEQAYFLEVSSPGLDRPLKKDSDFVRYKGETVELKLFQPIDGQKIFEGELIGLDENIISIKLTSSEIVGFDREKVAIVKRAVKFK
ncbi:MAG: ribosome maturation factor RimP [Bacillota bacterium]|nr:ribosome maturation factor RimP [Bacillota bacterium]